MNPYIKQFPDLMAGKKIMYVHGFLSSAQSGTVKMTDSALAKLRDITDAEYAALDLTPDFDP